MEIAKDFAKDSSPQSHHAPCAQSAQAWGYRTSLRDHFLKAFGLSPIGPMRLFQQLIDDASQISFNHFFLSAIKEYL